MPSTFPEGNKGELRKTMLQIRTDLERTIEALQTVGYDFSTDTWGTPLGWQSPRPIGQPGESLPFIEQIREFLPSLPLSLSLFWEIIGEVDLTGSFPVRPCPHSDPIQIISAADFWEMHQAQLIELKSDTVQTDSVALWLGADCLQKEGTSGSGYYLPLPIDDPVDFILEGEPHHLPFLDYLKLTCRWCGFPGFDFGGFIPQELEKLRSAILPIS